jgi:hypothetical protein
MEEEIDKILLANFTEGDWQTARKQLLDLFIVSNSVCLHEPQYQSYNNETKLQICDKCGAITN